MRLSIAICAAAAALLFAGWSGRAESAKAKAVKGSAPATFGNADAISEDELRIYLYFLASDQLEGRNFPSRGYDAAALYVASHLAEWGLKPGGSSSGTNGPLQPYLMPIELEAKQVIPEESKASLTAPAAGGRGGFGGGEAGAASAFRCRRLGEQMGFSSLGLCRSQPTGTVQCPAEPDVRRPGLPPTAPPSCRWSA